MSDDREPSRYDPLKQMHERIAEEEERQQTAEREREANSPEARLAAMETELAEKVRRGEMLPSDMAYQLRRFDNALVVEMNVEDQQQARDAASADRAEPRLEKPADGRSAPSAENEAETAERAAVSRDEPDARTARLARLREITQELAREQQERENNTPELGRDIGDRSR
jgi:hypothetical protein